MLFLIFFVSCSWAYLFYLLYQADKKILQLEAELIFIKMKLNSVWMHKGEKE